MNNRGNKLKLLYWLPGIIGGLAGLAVYAQSSGMLESISSAEAFQNYINGFGAKANIIFFIVQFVSVVIAPIPSNISAAAGGMIFGVWESFFISTTAILCGSAVVFGLARKLGKPFTEKFIDPKIETRYGHLIASKGEIFLILMFFLPFFPDDAICFLAGLSKIKWSRFIVITLLTRPWGILAASAVGSTNIAIPWWGWGVIVLILGISYMVVSSCNNKVEELIRRVNLNK